MRQVEHWPTLSEDKPTELISIADSGSLAPDDPSLSPEAALYGDVYEDYPEDDSRDTEDLKVAVEAAKDIREIANKLFKEGKIDVAFDKYQSKYHLNLLDSLSYHPFPV